MKTLDIARWMRTTAPLLTAHRRRGAGRHGTPFTFSFLVTNRCGLECRHCFYHQELARPSHDELTFEEYEQLSQRLGAFGMAVFAGGEPFARRDLADIVNCMRRNNELPLAGIATNGQATGTIERQTRRMLDYAPERPLNIAISLEGYRDVQDEIRGAGTFDRALRTWRTLEELARHQANLVLSLTLVVNTLNQDSAASFVRWAATELRPAAINVMLVRQSPRDGDHLKRVSPAKYRETQDAALEALGAGTLRASLNPQTLLLSAVADHVHQTMQTGRRAFHCHAGRHGAVVDYRGDVNVCEVFSEHADAGVIGNLRDFDMDFLALWNSPEAQRLRRCVNRHEACQACTHETVGLLPSLPFAPNRLSDLLSTGLREQARLCRIRIARRLPLVAAITGE